MTGFYFGTVKQIKQFPAFSNACTSKHRIELEFLIPKRGFRNENLLTLKPLLLHYLKSTVTTTQNICVGVVRHPNIIFGPLPLSIPQALRPAGDSSPFNFKFRLCVRQQTC